METAVLFLLIQITVMIIAVKLELPTDSMVSRDILNKFEIKDDSLDLSEMIEYYKNLEESTKW